MTEGFKRKLTAVFSADVAGYSRLMGEDESETVKTLETYKEVMFTLIKQHRGRVVDSPGDNVLAEFGSVVDAVQCGVSVQKEFQARNVGLPENRRMEFRVGINLGDVIEEEGRIYGDGVNIAARLESLAEPGGICVSKTAFEHIESKLPLGYQYLGEQTVKNIAKPVGAYRVVMEPRVTVAEEKQEVKVIPFWRRKATLAGVVGFLVVIIAVAVWNIYLRPPHIEPASVERMAYSLPDKPSIAVLPFVNMSGDAEQEYFSDGLTDQLIAALSKVRDLFVIARNSTFTYKGKPVKVQQVAEELGVRYVLEGSVRKSGDKLRVTVQLIDAVKGHHLWAEQYDREIKDVFAVQDDITKKIITALQVKLTEGEEARLWAKGTNNLAAYLKFLEAVSQGTRNRPPRETCAIVMRLNKEAISLDPNYAAAYIALAAMHLQDVYLKSTGSPEESLAKAIELAEKAINLDESYATAHALLGYLYTYVREYEKAIALCERALSLESNSYGVLIWCGWAYRYASLHEEAIRAFNKAVRLNPLLRSFPFRGLAGSYAFLGRYEEAIEAGRKAVEAAPNDPMSHVNLAAAYGIAGRDDEARAEAIEVLRVDPDFSLERYEKGANKYRNESDKEMHIGALRKAGLK